MLRSHLQSTLLYRGRSPCHAGLTRSACVLVRALQVQQLDVSMVQVILETNCFCFQIDPAHSWTG